MTEHRSDYDVYAVMMLDYDSEDISLGEITCIKNKSSD